MKATLGEIEKLDPAAALVALKELLGPEAAAILDEFAGEQMTIDELAPPEPEPDALEQALGSERARLVGLGCCPKCTDTLVESLRGWLVAHWSGVDEAERRAENARLFGSTGAAP